jgi:LysM repeat protein/lipoprotein-anchoring transpeptidase ErfK/SrfK
MVANFSFTLRFLPWLGFAVAQAQDVTAPPPPPATIEPGLEQAVKWKWRIEPGDAGAWAVAAAALPAKPGETRPAGETVRPAMRIAPEKALDHAVARGETLTVIARRHAVTIEQIKIFNALSSDVIRIGQVLRIPGRDDIKAMVPPPPAKDGKEKEASSTAKPAASISPPVLIAKKPKRALPPAAWGAAALVQTQVFLDRQGFTLGPIDGTTGPVYDAAFQGFEKARPGQLFTPDGQPSEAMRSIGGAYTEYELQADDLRWIDPLPEEATRKKSAPVPLPTFADLTSRGFLAYRSGWEFVAERFHASEAFLRRINPSIKSPNTPGTTFLVPNVEPFEIENALKPPLQPATDPAKPVKATIVELKRLIIRRGEETIASMPLSVARPGLRGRGTWKVLDVIPHPRFTSAGDPAMPSTVPITLASGPNNPAGFAWINLAKAADPQPLPYGLHGTSIPGHMMKQESIGGFRLTNWDLARVIRLLPAGTELTWQ